MWERERVLRGVKKESEWWGLVGEMLEERKAEEEEVDDEWLIGMQLREREIRDSDSDGDEM